MPGQYPSRGTFRPRLCDEAQQADATARLYLCARCLIQVVICSCCDRGNIYCARDCAEVSRRNAQRAAGQRYQRSLRGRRNHAARATRYRARQKIVTHHGSPREPSHDVMPHGARSTTSSHRSIAAQPSLFCFSCGRPCSPFVRRDFLRRRRGRDP